MYPENLLVSFLENADNVIYENSQEGLKNAWNNVLGIISDKSKLKISVDPSQIKSILDLSMAVTDTANTALTNLKNANVKIVPGAALKLVNTSEITRIEPNYLKDFVKAVTSRVAEASKSNDESIKLTKELVGSYDYSGIDDEKESVNWIKYKSNLVKSTISVYSKSKDIIDFSYLIKPFDMSTITRFYIPFLNDYVSNKTTNAPNAFESLVKRIIDVKDETDDNIKFLVNTIHNVKTISTEAGLRLSYAIISAYNELVKYLIAMTIRYIGGYVKNVQTIGKYITSYLIPETNCESVNEDGDDTDIPDFNRTIDSILESAQKIANDLQFSGVEPSEEYDKNAFDLPLFAFTMYIGRINEFNKCIENPTDININSIIDRCDLTPESFFKIISGETNNYNFFETVNYGKGFLLTDIKMIISRIPKFNEAFNNVLNSLSDTKSKIHLNENIKGETFTNDAINYINSIMMNINNSYKKFINSYIARINDIYDKITPDNEEISLDSNDFFADAYKANYEIMEESADERLSSMNDFYQREYAKFVCGAFFEDDNNQQNNNQNNNNNGSNNNQNNNQTNNSNNSNNAKPTVTDNDQSDNKNNSGNDNGNNNNNSNNNGENIISKLKDVINKVVDSIKKFINGDGKKNIEALNFHRNYLMQRSYSNIAVDVIPYQKRDYGDMLQKFIDAAITIDDTNLKKMAPAQIETALFRSISYDSAKVDNSNNGDMVSIKLETAIAVGAGKKVTKKYANSEVKQLVNDMIAYVENYYGENGIANSLEKINLDKLSALQNKKGDGNDDNTSKNVTYIQTCLNKAIAATKTVCKNRCNDYMVVLQSIWKNDPAGKANANNNNNANANTENNDQNTNGNQGDNNTNAT